MALQFRRIVTGHDGNGRAVVKVDEVEKRCQGPLISLSARPRSIASV